jgi:methyl-accepting chemotaxis protein
MPDDVFRIVIAAAVALACLAFLVQAGVSIALYRVARQMHAKIAPLVDSSEALVAKASPVIEQMGPVFQKAGPAVDKVNQILATTQRIMDDTRPRIAEIAAEAAAIAKSGHHQIDRLGNLVHDASDRARERLEQIDQSVDSTIEQVGQVGDAMKRAVMRPVREVNSVAAGISAAVSSLVRRKSSVDSATQDEEMFI